MCDLKVNMTHCSYLCVKESQEVVGKECSTPGGPQWTQFFKQNGGHVRLGVLHVCLGVYD
jgi:hypothetical protein